MPLFNSYKRDSMTGGVSLSADSAAGTLRVILLSASYTPDIDNHVRYTSVSAHEISFAHPAFAQGYSAGGQAISASVAFAVDTANDRSSFDAADNTWSSSTITARYLALVKVRASGANKENDNLVGVIDFGSDKSSSNGAFTIQWDSLGILLFT